MAEGTPKKPRGVAKKPRGVAKKPAGARGADLFTVESTFKVRGRGVVLLPGVSLEQSASMKVGDRLSITCPDGAVLHTEVRGVESPTSIKRTGKRAAHSKCGVLVDERDVPAGSIVRAAAKPKLLSGGNPQIAKADGDAPVQDYIAAMPGWKRDVGRRLDALVVRSVPNVRKAVRWNTPFYGIEGQGWFLAFHCITKYIKVTFFRGTSLRPVPPVESKNPGTRYFHIHENEWGSAAGGLDEELLASWIRQAAALPGETCF